MVKKNTANTGPTVFEFLAENPDLTTGEIARAQGKSMASVAGILAQLGNTGRIIRTGVRDGSPTWRVNDMPHDCSNPVRRMFEQLLKECRHASC